jgi:hypothetical protein
MKIGDEYYEKGINVKFLFTAGENSPYLLNVKTSVWRNGYVEITIFGRKGPS